MPAFKGFPQHRTNSILDVTIIIAGNEINPDDRRKTYLTSRIIRLDLDPALQAEFVASLPLLAGVIDVGLVTKTEELDG